MGKRAKYHRRRSLALELKTVSFQSKLESSNFARHQYSLTLSSYINTLSLRVFVPHIYCQSSSLAALNAHFCNNTSSSVWF